MIDEDRITAAQRGMRDRARSARQASFEPNLSSEMAAALRGKSRGYLEAADMLESLLRAGTIHRKYESTIDA